MKRGEHSERIAQALARIAAGETAYKAGKDAGISLSYLYKLLKRRRVSGQTTPA